jgi:atlastin
MDSQGLYDIVSSTKINQAIFYFTTVLSSIHIFNLKEILDKNNLHFISLFCEMAKDAFDKIDSKPFQVNKQNRK